MPLYMGGWIPYPHRVQLDGLQALNAVKLAPKLLQHPDMSSSDIYKIQDGVRNCDNFLKHPKGMTLQSYSKLSKFLTSYVNQRVLWCHGDRQNLVASAVPAVYELSKIDKSKLPEDLRLALERLADYGDFYEEVIELLSCNLCFGEMLHNQIDPRTQRRFTWTDISKDLKLYHESQNGADHLRDTPNFDLICKVSESIREAAQAMGAPKGAVEWQLTHYAIYQEHPLGPKRLLRTGNWPGLAKELTASLRALGGLWRGPFEVDCLQRNAARVMIIVLRLIEQHWFSNIFQDGNRPLFFLLADRAGELSRQIADTGSYRPRGDRRSVPMFNPADLNDALCARVKIRDYSLTWDSSAFILTYEGMDIRPLDGETWPQELDGYGLMSFLKVQPSRAQAIMKLWETVKAINSRLAAALPLEEWVLEKIKHDLEFTMISALRSPSFYTNKFLEKVLQVAGLDDHDMAKLGFSSLANRGIVCLTTHDGIAAIGEELPEHRKSSLAVIANQLASGYVPGNMDYILLTPQIEHCTIPSENPCAVIIIEAMDRAANQAIKAADEELDEMTEVRVRRAWIDLNLALRHVLNEDGPIDYDEKLCKEIVINAGKTNIELYMCHFVRHPTFGLLRRGQLPGF
ncbi:hypothetical protein DTO207G8_6879 [Paecilomyces variotii]|nr:hypothetical protein DTO169E5_6838 [Paecilomyces variotii]KAJ9249225.1 hypothetical protein DTO207G8_6879 [Paecilomyces variotii]KAJ9383524.1 hypothetical protein DTO063F5_5181 [Paecilomyces variotii]